MTLHRCTPVGYMSSQFLTSVALPFRLPPYRTVVLGGLLDLVLIVIDTRDLSSREKGNLTQRAPNTTAHIQNLRCRQ